jgi:hypothetical protein
MTARFRRVAVFVGTAALATGAGVGVAAQGDSTPSDQPSETRQMGPGGGAPAGGGLDVSALADELGVSEAEMQQAMQKARPTDPSTAGGPDAMFQALADELGISVDKVRAAFAKILPQGGPPSGGGQTAPPSGQTAPQSGATSQS